MAKFEVGDVVEFVSNERNVEKRFFDTKSGRFIVVENGMYGDIYRIVPEDDQSHSGLWFFEHRLMAAGDKRRAKLDVKPEYTMWVLVSKKHSDIVGMFKTRDLARQNKTSVTTIMKATIKLEKV